jgi:hypothetical protein
MLVAIEMLNAMNAISEGLVLQDAAVVQPVPASRWWILL